MAKNGFTVRSPKRNFARSIRASASSTATSVVGPACSGAGSTGAGAPGSTAALPKDGSTIPSAVRVMVNAGSTHRTRSSFTPIVRAAEPSVAPISPGTDRSRMPSSKSFHATPNSFAVFSSPTSRPARPSVPETCRSLASPIESSARAFPWRSSPTAGASIRESSGASASSRIASFPSNASGSIASVPSTASDPSPCATRSAIGQRLPGSLESSPISASTPIGSGSAPPSSSTTARSSRALRTPQVHGFAGSAASAAAASAPAGLAIAGTGSLDFASTTNCAPTSATSATAALCFSTSIASSATRSFSKPSAGRSRPGTRTETSESDTAPPIWCTPPGSKWCSIDASSFPERSLQPNIVRYTRTLSIGRFASVTVETAPGPAACCVTCESSPTDPSPICATIEIRPGTCPVGSMRSAICFAERSFTARSKRCGSTPTV